MAIPRRNVYEVQVPGPEGQRLLYSWDNRGRKKSLEREINSAFQKAFLNAEVVKIKEANYYSKDSLGIIPTTTLRRRVKRGEATLPLPDAELENLAVASPGKNAGKTDGCLRRFFTYPVRRAMSGVDSDGLKDSPLLPLIQHRMEKTQQDMRSCLSFLSGYDALSKMAPKIMAALPPGAQQEFAKFLAVAIEQTIKSAQALLFLRKNNDYVGGIVDGIRSRQNKPDGDSD